MSTHNIGFYEDLTKILSLNYHQIRTLFLLLPEDRFSHMYAQICCDIINEKIAKSALPIRNFQELFWI